MAKNNLQVDITEATENEVRTITITITGAAEEFLLADLLAQRKAICPSATVLKNAALEATKSYLESAEEVINGVKSDQKKDGSSAGETTPKRGRKVRDEASADDFRLGTMTAKTTNGSAVSRTVAQ
jgi:hypothetical protein